MLDYYDGVKILRDKETKEPIGVEWIWNDGTKEHYYPRDLNEAWFINYVNEVKMSENLDRKERYHIGIHLDALAYEGEFFTDEKNPRSDLNWLEEEKRSSVNMAKKGKVFLWFIITVVFMKLQKFIPKFRHKTTSLILSSHIIEA